MSQIATTVSELKNDPGRLPSQSVPNPRGNVSMMEVVDVDAALKESAYWVNKMLALDNTEAKNSEEEPSLESTRANTLGMPGPGPVLTAESSLTNVPSCSMHVTASEGRVIDKDEPGGRLEDRPEQNDPMMEHPLATSHKAPPEKSKDPGAFTFTCGIGEAQIHHCLIDLGAAINAMPYSLYCSLKLGPLKPPKLIIELGDKSCIRHVGLLENLTLRVGDLVVPVDFYVLQMGDARDDDPPALILGRPFLFATKTKIDMDIGLLSLAFGGKTSDFYIYEDVNRPCAKKPPDIVNTSYLGALVPDLPDETSCAANEVAMSKVSSRTREDLKANPPDRWRGDTSTPLHDDFGQTEGIAEAKFYRTRPWDPNL
ncbi:unnamed protein product [Rhodiola kirilowii]